MFIRFLVFFGLAFVASAPATRAEDAAQAKLAARAKKIQITQDEVFALMKRAGGDQIMKMRESSPAQFEKLYDFFRVQLLRMKVVSKLAMAHKKELLKDPAIKKAYRQVIETFFVQAYLQDLYRKQISEEDLKKEHEGKKQEKISLSQIVLLDKATANRALRALQQGKKFQDVAKSSSTDAATAKNGGKLPDLLMTQLPLPLRKAVEKLPVGGFSSEPVKVGDRLFIFRLNSRQKATFDEARPALQQGAQARILQGLLDPKAEEVVLYDLSGKKTKKSSLYDAGNDLASGAAQGK
jgi:parvulin-like peptidyl-prolyl isomerase